MVTERCAEVNAEARSDALTSLRTSLRGHRCTQRRAVLGGRRVAHRDRAARLAMGARPLAAEALTPTDAHSDDRYLDGFPLSQKSRILVRCRAATRIDVSVDFGRGLRQRSLVHRMSYAPAVSA